MYWHSLPKTTNRRFHLSFWRGFLPNRLSLCVFITEVMSHPLDLSLGLTDAELLADVRPDRGKYTSWSGELKIIWNFGCGSPWNSVIFSSPPMKHQWNIVCTMSRQPGRAIEERVEPVFKYLCQKIRFLRRFESVVKPYTYGAHSVNSKYFQKSSCQIRVEVWVPNWCKIGDDTSGIRVPDMLRKMRTSVDNCIFIEESVDKTLAFHR